MAAGSVVGTVSVQQKIANGYTFAFIILENKKKKDLDLLGNLKIKVFVDVTV